MIAPEMRLRWTRSNELRFEPGADRGVRRTP
jgi:hypothetical protein